MSWFQAAPPTCCDSGTHYRSGPTCPGYISCSVSNSNEWCDPTFEECRWRLDQKWRQTMLSAFQGHSFIMRTQPMLKWLPREFGPSNNPATIWQQGVVLLGLEMLSDTFTREARSSESRWKDQPFYIETNCNAMGPDAPGLWNLKDKISPKSLHTLVHLSIRLRAGVTEWHFWVTESSQDPWGYVELCSEWPVKCNKRQLVQAAKAELRDQQRPRNEAT